MSLNALAAIDWLNGGYLVFGFTIDFTLLYYQSLVVNQVSHKALLGYSRHFGKLVSDTTKVINFDDRLSVLKLLLKNIHYISLLIKFYRFNHFFLIEEI